MVLLVSGALAMQGVPTAAFAEPTEPVVETEASTEAGAGSEAATTEIPAEDAADGAQEQTLPSVDQDSAWPTDESPATEDPAETEGSTPEEVPAAAEDSTETEADLPVEGAPAEAEHEDPAPADPDDAAPADPESDAEEELAAASSPAPSTDWTYETYSELDENEDPYDVYVVTGYAGTATKITIPSTIDGKAMYGVASNFELGTATEVTISSGIECLYGGAFENATLLTKVTFAPNSKVKKIGQRTFKNTSISQLVLPDSVEEIGIEALSYCPNLTTVHLGANLAPMSYEGRYDYTTYDNETLYVSYYFSPAMYSPNVSWDVSPACENYKVVDGALYSKDGTVLYWHPAGQASVTIDSGVKHIAGYAFL